MDDNKEEERKKELIRIVKRIYRNNKTEHLASFDIVNLIVQVLFDAKETSINEQINLWQSAKWYTTDKTIR